LGLPYDDPAAATDALLAALDREPRRIDAGVIRHGDLRTWFASVVSAGFDAVVNERANRMTRPRGPSRYTLALARELATFRPRTYVITIDGVRREQRAMLVSVANNPSLGGGMRIVPHADLADGLLDVFIVHPLSRSALVRVFPKVFAGTHVDHPAVEFVRASRVRIEADDIVAYADGERIGRLPIEVDVVPGALSVFA
uniref:diacylglycerol kinase n=1 Tax=Agromyces humi TaxID=1766800 RepID=UPI00135A1075